MDGPLLHLKISGYYYLFEIENCRIQVRCYFTKIITRVELLPNFTLSTYLDIFLQVSPLEKTFLRIKCKSSFLVLKSTLIATWSRKWVHTYLYFWLTSFRSHVKLPLLVTQVALKVIHPKCYKHLKKAAQCNHWVDFWNIKLYIREKLKKIQQTRF